jgi:hypothetical protein
LAGASSSTMPNLPNLLHQPAFLKYLIDKLSFDYRYRNAQIVKAPGGTDSDSCRRVVITPHQPISLGFHAKVVIDLFGLGMR